MPTPSILQKTLSSMRKHARRSRLAKAGNARPLGQQRGHILNIKHDLIV